MKFLSIVWKDGVGSKVIATAICAAVGWGIVFFQAWWPSVHVWLLAALAYGTLKLLTPYWVIGLVLLLGAWGWLLCVRHILMTARAKRLPFPHDKYRSDTFDGLTWRWKYTDTGAIRELVPHCPGCDYLVHAQFGFSAAATIETQYRCEDCKTPLPPVAMKYGDHHRIVSRKVMARISKQDYGNR